jgi:hypothetical protein
MNGGAGAEGHEFRIALKLRPYTSEISLCAMSHGQHESIRRVNVQLAVYELLAMCSTVCNTKNIVLP